MITNTSNLESPQIEPVLRTCIGTLRRVAEYRMPKALDRRLLWLSENKSQLDATQREELMALVDLADRRGLDKVQAQSALAQLEKCYPALVNGNS